MLKPSSPPQGLAAVAIGFDSQTDALVRGAATLARRFDLELRLVNALENIVTDPWVMDMPAYHVAPTLIRQAQEKLMSERQSQLNALTEHLPRDVRASAQLIIGDPVRTIIADAIAHKANFIITACNPESYGRFMPQGFSTALSLMAEAPLPVLVQSREHPLDLTRASFRILLADDLTHGTREAARKAYELAARLGPACELLHVHVRSDWGDILRTSWDELARRNPLLKNQGQTPERLAQDEEKARLEKLKQHGQPHQTRALESGVKIAVTVRTGKIELELQMAEHDFDPDLMIFGRHKFFHAKPLLIGRMPLRSMLHGKDRFWSYRRLKIGTHTCRSQDVTYSSICLAL